MSTHDTLRNWVRGHLGRLIGIPPESIALDRKLSDYGLDSVDAVLMAGELEDQFGIEIDPASFIQYHTFDAMITSLEKALETPSSNHAAPPTAI
jgi:acyl carrier protein